MTYYKVFDTPSWSLGFPSVNIFKMTTPTSKRKITRLISD